MTARLTVTFHRPVPIGRRIRAEGWVVDGRRRMSRTAATITDAETGEILASAEATYVAAPEDRRAELKARYRFRLVPDDAGARRRGGRRATHAPIPPTGGSEMTVGMQRRPLLRRRPGRRPGAATASRRPGAPRRHALARDPGQRLRCAATWPRPRPSASPARPSDPRSRRPRGDAPARPRGPWAIASTSPASAGWRPGSAPFMASARPLLDGGRPRVPPARPGIPPRTSSSWSPTGSCARSTRSRAGWRSASWSAWSATDPERTWQLIRRAAREAGDWITIDTLAHAAGRGILNEPYRWAELEQLAYSPSRWERRLVGSTIATIPFVNHGRGSGGGRNPEVAAHALPLLAQLIGDAEPDVQKALSWAYRIAPARRPDRRRGGPDGGGRHRRPDR